MQAAYCEMKYLKAVLYNRYLVAMETAEAQRLPSAVPRATANARVRDYFES